MLIPPHMVKWKNQVVEKEEIPERAVPCLCLESALFSLFSETHGNVSHPCLDVGIVSDLGLLLVKCKRHLLL